MPTEPVIEHAEAPQSEPEVPQAVESPEPGEPASQLEAVE